MKIAIGSDNAGFGLKEFLKGKLIEAGYEVEDLGTLRRDAEIRYMDAADRVAKAVQSGAAARGILCCGTGMGMSICANKHKGLYCAVVESQWAAYNCRFINNANMLALGERIVAPSMAWDMVQTFLNTAFHEGADETRAAVLEALVARVAERENEWF